MNIGAIRGAITVDENTPDAIINTTSCLLQEIIKKNQLQISDIISIYFTATDDLDAAYPAIAARQLGITQAALMCFQEMKVIGSLGKCIRVVVQICTPDSQAMMHHIYLKEAASLRPDLAINKKE
ncbi:MAG: chorismate mutase [Epulopiscium sp.]|nr:chorismate mutase [Candidatus Epulonipiscium sp.]